MVTATCSWCQCEVPAVDRPTMCASCGLMIFPDGAAPPDESEMERPQAVEPEAAIPLDLSPWRGLERHRAPADEAPPVAIVEPVVEPVESPTPAPAPARKIVGQSVQVHSVWHSFQFIGRDGVQCAAVLAIYSLLALTFLAIVFEPFSPRAWAWTVFAVLQGFSALVYAGARYVNRRALLDDVERAVLWFEAPLLPCIAFNAGVLSLHSTAAGLWSTALVVTNAIVLHRRLAAPIAARPGRALQFVATGLLATTGLAPLLGAFPPLVACAVAALLWQGQTLVTRRTRGQEALQPFLMMRVSVLLLLGALTTTIGLTRGAWFHGAAALPVWGMFLTSMVLVFRNHCANDPQALSADARKWLDPGVEIGLLAGFVLTFGDPVGMLVTGAVAAVALLRDSLRSDRPILLLPAVAISLAVYAWLPDPRCMGIAPLRTVVPPAIVRLTGAAPLAADALCLAPWAIAVVAAGALLFQRGRERHARMVGACAIPAGLAACAGMLAGANHHWVMGASLAITGAALVVCGLFARQLLAVIPGSVGLLVGVGSAAAARNLSYAAIELAMTATVLVVLLAFGATTRRSAEFVRFVSRRWVDAATLFVLTAIPVAASAYSFGVPPDTTAVANELALGLLAFLVACAWRRPEATVVAAALFGRACLGFIALRLPDVSALCGVEAMAAASALPVLLWFLTPLVPLERRRVAAAAPGVAATLLPVVTIQAFAAWKYARALVGVEMDVATVALPLLLVLTPWIGAVIAGLRAGAPRRSEVDAAAA